MTVGDKVMLADLNGGQFSNPRKRGAVIDINPDTGFLRIQWDDGTETNGLHPGYVRLEQGTPSQWLVS